MFAAHIYLNGHCKEAIDLYVKVFQAEIETIILNPENQDIVDHAEILIHDQILMMNDFGNLRKTAESGGYQLSVRFSSEDELLEAYRSIQEASTTIFSMQATDYSPCVVRFADKFDVLWAFWV